jgi:hypothetical protein
MQVGLEGSPLGQWWLDMIGKTLDEGSSFVRVGSRQLAGLLICVWLVLSFNVTFSAHFLQGSPTIPIVTTYLYC